MRAGGKDTTIGFDGASAEVGWNRIGEYELRASEVRLEVSSQTDGEMVVADAIRWIRVE